MAFCDLLHTFHKQFTNVSKYPLNVRLSGEILTKLKKKRKNRNKKDDRCQAYMKRLILLGSIRDFQNGEGLVSG